MPHTVQILRDAARSAVNEAMNGNPWSGWEWCHDASNMGYPTDGHVVDGYDDGTRAKGWRLWAEARAATLCAPGVDAKYISQIERNYGQHCQRDADRARSHARECLDCIASDDYCGAYVCARKCRDIESSYGDAPTYGPMLAAVAAWRDAAETAAASAEAVR